QVQWQGEFFNQPMLAFEVSRHNGVNGKNISLLSSDNPAIGVMAIKKMEEADYYIVRVNELFGRDQKNASLTFGATIEDAYEVNGQEEKIGSVNFSKNKLNIDLSHYTIRSFAVKLAPQRNIPGEVVQQPVTLPYNNDVISNDDNRDDGNFSRRSSIPAELIGNEVVSEDVRFKIGGKADGELNAVMCRGQKINLPSGQFTTLHLLAAAGNDTKADFLIDNIAYPLQIQRWTGYVGQFYNRQFATDGITVTAINSPYSKQDNIAWFASHSHQAYPSANRAYQYSYLYKYDIPLPAGAKTITLPNNESINILAITVDNKQTPGVEPLQPLYDDFKEVTQVKLR
ncbi:MAG: glycosyl hydrolase-related protein, partial [Candidatus Dadabacteria bacterium]